MLCMTGFLTFTLCIGPSVCQKISNRSTSLLVEAFPLNQVDDKSRPGVRVSVGVSKFGPNDMR